MQGQMVLADYRIIWAIKSLIVDRFELLKV
jgi:hypothetical protein